MKVEAEIRGRSCRQGASKAYLKSSSPQSRGRGLGWISPRSSEKDPTLPTSGSTDFLSPEP